MRDWLRLGRLVGAVLRTTSGPRLRTIRAWRRDPAPTQKRLLLDLCRTASQTRFGREHGFAGVRSVRDFQDHVPLRTYLEFKPYWDTLFEGETDVTWPGRIERFALTSGTTAGNKYIPLSAEGVRAQRRAGRDIVNFYLEQTGDTALFGGKFLFLGGSTELVRLSNGALAGDLSGIMTCRMPCYADLFRLPSSPIALMGDWEKKLDAMAAEAEPADVRGVSGTPSWLFCLFEQVLERRRARGRPAETVADVWPGFRLLVHGGVNYEPYRESMKKLLGKPVHTMEVYPASEGFIAIQDNLDSNDMLLMMDTGIFYEFVPRDDIASDDPRRFTVADVETGVDYALVLSTNSGLWSYVLGDTVRFTSLRPHRLRVSGRTAHFLSAFGEHLISEEVEEAVAGACRTTGAEIRDFHVAPIYPGRGNPCPAHEWFVEFVKPPPDAQDFILEVDRRLQRHNDDYAAHRQGDAGMSPPVLSAVPRGGFRRAMKRIGKLGGQNKVPRLRNDREFADVLAQWANVR